MATIDELRALAREIREERQIGGNTGERVGNTFEKVADLLDSTGGDISDIHEAVEQLLQDVGFIPRDISRTATDAVFTNSEGELLFWLRAATDTLAGLITAANNNKLIALPTAEELAQALAAKQNRLTFDPQPIEGSTNPVTSDGIHTAIANFVTRSVSDLIYYYTKSETYTKEEVNALVAAIKQFVPVVAQTLPTPSADTMYKLYLIPSEDPQESNIKDEYITIDNGASANPRYTWEKIGSVDIDISGKADIGTVPADVTRTQTDATFVNSDNEPLFYLRQASDSLAGLMTAAEHNKLDALPTAQDLNTSLDSIIYDVSAKNPTAGPNNDGKFTLAYILNPSNVNTLIPTAYRKGGMSIKFVLSSDNKYVQYRLTSNTFTTTDSEWQKQGAEVSVSQNTGGGRQLSAGDNKLMGIYDFINVNVYAQRSTVYSSLTQARNAILSADRKRGLVIAARFTAGWWIEQYIGGEPDNTWTNDSNWKRLNFSVINSLISDSETDALSAKQGKILLEKIQVIEELYKVSSGTGWLKTDGTIATSPSHGSYDVFDIPSGTTNLYLTATYSLSPDVGWALCQIRDNNDNFIRAIEITTSIQGGVTDLLIDISQDTGASKIYLTKTTTSRLQYLSSKSVGEHVSALDSNVNIIRSRNQWEGKKIVWLGTSIPYGTSAADGGRVAHPYPEQISKRLGCTVLNNCSPGLAVEANYDESTQTWTPKTSGSLSLTLAEYAAAGESNPGVKCYENSLLGQDADLYVFDCEPNNSDSSVEILDNFNMNTWAYRDGSTFDSHRDCYIGALLYLLDRLWQEKPSAKVVLVGESGYARDYYETYGMRAASKALCDALRIPYISLWSKMYYNPLNMSLYLNTDKVHPKQAGYDRMANILTNELLLIS